jgi:hypothetical protein
MRLDGSNSKSLFNKSIAAGVAIKDIILEVATK